MILRNIPLINKGKVFNTLLQTQPITVRSSQICDEFIPNVYKAQCLEGIKNGVERVFIVKKDSGKLLHECIGGQNFCVIDSIPQDSSSVLLHGHIPLKGTDVSLPVSLNDFEIINNSSIDKIIAYDINGRQSFLEKNKDFIPLDKKQISELKKKYIDLVIASMNAEQLKKIKSLLIYCKQHPESVAVKQEIANCLYQAQFNINTANNIDKFWLNNAPNINLNYKSFSD